MSERVLGVCPCGRPFDASTGYDGKKRGGPRRAFCQPSCREREASRRARGRRADEQRRADQAAWAAAGQQMIEVQ